MQVEYFEKWTHEDLLEGESIDQIREVQDEVCRMRRSRIGMESGGEARTRFAGELVWQHDRVASGDRSSHDESCPRGPRLGRDPPKSALPVKGWRCGAPAEDDLIRQALAGMGRPLGEIEVAAPRDEGIDRAVDQGGERGRAGSRAAMRILGPGSL